MTTSARGWRTALSACAVLVWLSHGTVFAFQVRARASRFDSLLVENPTSSLDVATTPVASLPKTESRRAAWDGFRAVHGEAWSIYLDRRSGAPMLVEGRGIPWDVNSKSTVDSLADSLRPFIASHRTLLLASDADLVVDHDASGQLNKDVWQISFSRLIAGVPVHGERYVFTIGHGSLISFGAPRWSRIDASPFPDIDAREAQARMSAYMGLKPGDSVKVSNPGRLQLIALRAASASLGEGYTSALVWRMAMRVDGEPGTWEALIDAHTGVIRSFADINDYAQVKGGVSADGVEQGGRPMPYTNVTIGGSPQTTSALGIFNCSPAGSPATATLAGPYVKVVDTCGVISETGSCDNDLDLQSSPGTDCSVPPGTSAGNTHASRTGFYQLNRIAEHARVWLPTRTWLTQQLTDNVNINQACNAYWNGSSVNFFKSGGGCNNSGEITGVLLHEWGHGMDANDGGGADNPGEAYADITAFMSTHSSCIGRGFANGDCDGYGDACLSCTGIRDQDWDKHASHTPATPADFLSNRCASGVGPCGKEVHCESHVGAEALWDLATRDLPASGLEGASSWQLADKRWYQSRLGSGGSAYTCALPNSDGCSATSWFAKLRTVDDDDGNLANGTPHAAAIFAAFDRHKIACGAAGDAGNQSSTTCPAIGAPTLTATAGSTAAQLSWSPVVDAVAYDVFRNDVSCASGSTLIATVPGSTFTDTGLINGFTEYYSVQPEGANAACDGRLSNCQAVTPRPFAGLVRLDAAKYNCAGTILVTITDENIGAATTTVKLTSGTESLGETITLTQVAPGAPNYAGSIVTIGGVPAFDGKLSVANGDTITAAYIDADDGQGGINITRTATAVADCVFPILAQVASSNLTGSSARITWDTNEPATSAVHYGLSTPPSSTTAVPALVVGHVVDLAGLTECSNYVYSVASADAVGNTVLDNNAGSYYAFSTGKNPTRTYASSDGPVAIPDSLPSGASSTIVVPDNSPVQKVTVTLNLTHTYDGDLVVTLIPPAGAPIMLSNARGGAGANFAATVFDDAALTSIVSGAAPFTGSFAPETPLAAANGINAAGTWQLHVVDSAARDVGTIDNWTLSITYPAAACGAHAAFQSFAEISDTCATGGAGNANSIWDAGEHVNFKVTIKNDGTTPLTHPHATITSATPGVVMTHGAADFPSIPIGATADSLAPHFTAALVTGLACGGTASFQVTITTDQGSWSGGTFTHGVGVVSPGGGSALNETFAGGIPPSWTIVDGGFGGGGASTWTTANPGARTIASPMAAPTAIVDSDNAGSTLGTVQDEQLITPALDLSTATSVTLQFDEYFRYFQGNLSEAGDVDVRSTLTAGAWTNVLVQQGSSSPNPDHKTLNITAQAAGAANAQVRFHYFNGHNEWYWQLDNVRVDFATPGVCSQNVCAAPAAVAKPVADGSFGTAMTASRAGASGSSISLTWDVFTCASTDHHVLYGDLAGLASATVSGSACDLSATGSATWSGVPAGNLWFVVVGDDNATTEGSWGTKTSGQRGGASASGQCGMASRDNSGTCP